MVNLVSHDLVLIAIDRAAVAKWKQVAARGLNQTIV
jgi:hypothetical protein